VYPIAWRSEEAELLVVGGDDGLGLLLQAAQFTGALAGSGQVFH
jgi:hypothetical protein